MATLLPLVGIVLLFWLFIIRPQSRRQKELRNMQSSLSVEDEVMLTSGVYATVRSVEDDHVKVEIAEGVVIKVARGAIGNKIAQDVDEVDDERVETDTDNKPGVIADGPEEN
ncbi:preprotein translocase subunit YajC [Nocardioides sp. URHA0020]|uniref:preprotein translocase subunit YajC n=1 Tax=Nocardioides sp. URHA0020 TaxID=1380392 RepID=UPI0006889229|nr:preprotein translocase subunit YajC [Nocardioides sp. URHA0020]